MPLSNFKNIHGQIFSPLVHFSVKNCIGEIGIIVKNEILASTSVLSYLGWEMIKVSGLGICMGVIWVEWWVITSQIQ